MIYGLKIGDKVFCKKDEILNFFGKNEKLIENLSIKKNNTYDIIDINEGSCVYYIVIKVYEDDVEMSSLIFIKFKDNIDEILKETYYSDYYNFEDHFLTNIEYRKMKLENINYENR